MQHTLVYIFLPLLCRTKTWNYTSRFKEEMPRFAIVRKKFRFWVLVLFFFHCSSFFTLLAASISHFLTDITKFSSFFQRNSSPMLYFSRHCSFSVIHVSVDIKIWSKKWLALLLLFLSKCPGGHAIYHQNERVLECEISLRLICRGVRTDAGHMIAQICLIYRLPIFLTHDASLRALRERSAMRIIRQNNFCLMIILNLKNNR